MGFCDRVNGKLQPGPYSTAYVCFLVNAFQSPWCMLKPDHSPSVVISFLISATQETRGCPPEANTNGLCEHCVELDNILAIIFELIFSQTISVKRA